MNDPHETLSHTRHLFARALYELANEMIPSGRSYEFLVLAKRIIEMDDCVASQLIFFKDKP
jgi:hypothetical protein